MIEVAVAKKAIKILIWALIAIGILIFLMIAVIGLIVALPILLIMGTFGHVSIPATNGQSMIPPEQDLVYYIEASKKYENIPPWYILASTNYVESSYGQNTLVQRGVANFAGAMGPMQFLPTTFVAYAVTDIGTDINSSKDSIFATANMYHQNILRSGGWPTGLSQAIFDYNHSQAYVQKIEQDAFYIQTHTPPALLIQAQKEVLQNGKNQNATTQG